MTYNSLYEKRYFQTSIKKMKDLLNHIVVKNTTMEKVLETYFGYQSFRPKQKEIIEAIIAKKDTMSFFATGFGKSLCFILPALITNKVVVVICPLISLMQDQVNDLVKRNISVCFLGSHQTSSKIIKDAFAGEYNIIYITQRNYRHLMRNS